PASPPLEISRAPPPGPPPLPRLLAAAFRVRGEPGRAVGHRDAARRGTRRAQAARPAPGSPGPGARGLSPPPVVGPLRFLP
ncbi:MAG: hypothetical protein ACC662_00415, partial [Planctomycetota bacterium]